MDVFYILTSAWKENHKMCPDLKLISCWIVMCSADLTCVNGSTIQLVLREFQGLTYGFLNKKFQEIIYLSLWREDNGDREGIPHTHAIP